MRREYILLLLICLIGCKTEQSTPSPDPITPNPSISDEKIQSDMPPTALPESADAPLIQPFTASYSCELQNEQASTSEGEYCRSESIQEVIAAEGDDVIFIHRTYHRGYGCWTGINSYMYELHTCNMSTGERVTLTDQQTTPLLPSPDGSWFAFGVIDVEQFEPHVYRVGSDGMALQQLDTQPLPDWAVSVVLLEWSSDGEWLVLKLWDGSTDGWHPYRIATDGSGIYETVPLPGMTPSPAITQTQPVSSTPSASAESFDAEIPGDLGESHAFTWELSATGKGPVEREHSFNVTGMSPGSPNRSSRRLFLEMSCEGEGSEQFRWTVIGAPAPEEEGDLGCDDAVTAFATAEQPHFGVLIESLMGNAVAMSYTLQITVHAPY